MNKSIFFYLSLMLTLVISFNASAQEEEEEITEEEIRLFAWMEDTVAYYKEVQETVISENINASEVLKGMYNDIKQAYPDSVKLVEIGATAEQITAYEDIVKFTEERIESIRQLKIDLIKEEVTVKAYNKIRKAMKTDPELKAKVDEYMAEFKALREDNENADADSDDE